MFGSGRGRSVVKAELPNDRIVSFVNLVEAMAIHDARWQTRLGLEQIRLQVEQAETAWEKPHVLARKHRMYRFGKQLIIELEDSTLVGASRKVRNQRYFRPIVENYLRPLRDHSAQAHAIVQPWAENAAFGDDGLVRSLVLDRGPDDLQVVLDPHVHFGEPIIMPCGLRVRTLIDAVAGEGSVQAAASLYEVPAQAIDLAFRFASAKFSRAA
ncbi:MAG: hypothetical protein ACKVS8_07955 [Phycisphaerales bacterium]